jgi:hypothetical protein
MPSTINAIPDVTSGQLRKKGAADANLTLQTNGINAVTIDQNQNANFVSTGAITLPKGTTAQRPNPAVNGMWRVNTDYAYFEVYVNNTWANLTPILTPINTVAPAISGTAVVGNNITVSNGTWSNNATSYTYQWYANATAISNATFNSFAITSTQNGANLFCSVLAANSLGNAAAAANSNVIGPVTALYTASFLVIGGGGGGPAPGTGGGGAGGFVDGTRTFSPGIVYTATIGGGGGQGSSSTLTGSDITTVTGLGGGQGGANQQGANGGSGGGGGSYYNGAGGSATQPGSASGGYGNAGGYGNCCENNFGGGGGGGAGGGGQSGNGSGGGAGGIGRQSSITGTATYYAGGGSGTGDFGGRGGGAGGGGNAGSSGTANTGGGGGGNYAGGGSGLVILSVPTSSFSNTYSGSNVVVTTSGSNTIISFNSSGTYTA